MASDRFTIGARTIAEGAFTFGPVQIARERTKIEARLDATQHLNSGVTLGLVFEASYDSGVNWVFVTSSSRQGGVAFGDGGVVENNIYFTLALEPEQGNTRRRIRCSATLTGGSFVTSGGFIEASD